MQAGAVTLGALLAKSQDPDILNAAAYELADANLDLGEAHTAARLAVEMQELKTRGIALASLTQQDLQGGAALAAAWDTLGWVNYREGKLALAETYIRASWDLTQHPEVGKHLAEIYEKQNQRLLAYDTYRLAHVALPVPLQTAAQKSLQAHLQERIQALLRSAAHAGDSSGFAASKWPGPEELRAIRCISVANPAPGASTNADFYLLFGASGVEDIRFVRGNAALQSFLPQLKTAKYNPTLPAGSRAHIALHGILYCAASATKCEFVLLSPQGAPL